MSDNTEGFEMKVVEVKNEITIMYQDHPRINSVTHKFKGTISFEKAIEKVITNHQKRLKLLD